MTAVKRLVLILLAYGLASLFTGYMVWASLFLDPSRYTGMREPSFGLFITFMVAWTAGLPAAPTIAISEFKGWRMAWLYATAGSLIGLGLGSLFQPPTWFPWLGLGLGPVSGLIYWAIAVRWTGPADATTRRAIVVVMVFVAVALAVTLLPSISR